MGVRNFWRFFALLALPQSLQKRAGPDLAMANATAPDARTIHGTNPQYLIEKIVRTRVYAARYWKEHCFGLTAETLVDKALRLDHAGGTYSSMAKATPFLCLLLKLLAIQPDLEVIAEYLQQEDHKYLRALGACYLRFTGRPVEVYTYLEPLLLDHRKLALRTPAGWELTHMDEFIDALLVGSACCGLAMPRLPARETLESTGALEGPRASEVEDLLEGEGVGGEGEAAGGAAADLLHRAMLSGSGTGRADNRPAWMLDGSGAAAAAMAAAAATASSSSSSSSAAAAAAASAPPPEAGDRKRPRTELPAAPDPPEGGAAPAKAKPKYAPFVLKGSKAAPAAAAAAPPPSDSVEAWNVQRQALGLKPLA
jgi:pre-mRNA-splicing factor 38A